MGNSSSNDSVHARGAVYRLLARLWLQEVDSATLSRLSEPPLGDLFTAVGGVLPDGSSKSAVEELAIDYCRLFLGPVGHLPPYQSVWAGGAFQGEAAGSMRQFIDAVGYDLAHSPQAGMPDHFGVQLDVMGYLLEQVASLPEDLVGQCDPAPYFMTHLDWPAALLEHAAERAETDFYRALVEMTREFLELESSHFAAAART